LKTFIITLASVMSGKKHVPSHSEQGSVKPTLRDSIPFQHPASRLA